MSTLALLFLALATPNAAAPDLRTELAFCAPGQDVPSPEAPAPGGKTMTFKKDGGPGAGPDQPYTVRERAASDLEQFAGGQVVFVEPYDWFLVFLLIATVVVIVIII